MSPQSPALGSNTASVFSPLPLFDCFNPLSLHISRTTQCNKAEYFTLSANSPQTAQPGPSKKMNRIQGHEEDGIGKEYGEVIAF